MIQKNLVLFIWLTLAFGWAAPGPASENLAPSAFRPPLGNKPSVSVYSISPWRDGAIIATGGLATLLPFVFASRLITPHCPCGRSQVGLLDNSVIGNHDDLADHLSDVTVGLAIGLPVILDGIDVGLNSVFIEDVVVFAETLAVSGALVTATKFIVQRPLPRVYEGNDPRINTAGGYVSFYSGHTSTTMAALSAAAMTLTLRHGTGWLPWAVTGAAGILVGSEKILAGTHFFTDVAVGFIVGTAVGITVPWLHRNRPAGGLVSFVPMPGGMGLAFQRPL